MNDNRFYYRRFSVHNDNNGVRSRPYIVYTVKNRQYEISSKIVYGGIAAFFMKGRKFKVFYNPHNPYDAVLKNEINFYFQCGSFCIFILLSFFFLFMNLLYDGIHQEYQYTVFCTINGTEYEMTEKVIANSEKKALEKLGITNQICENVRLVKENK